MTSRAILIATFIALSAPATVAHADEMFQPQATLTPERKKDQYTLRVETSAPNSCYRAGSVRVGPPASVRLTPEVLAVRVNVSVRRGACAQMVTTLKHQHRRLRLGGKSGKTRVMVFVMQGNEVLGSTSVESPMSPQPPNPPPTDPPPPPAKPPYTSADWNAWVNKMPPGPASFHVTGTVNLPTPGYDAKLVYASPQGINPKELILDLVVTPKSGMFPQVITSVTVRYDKKPYDTAYTGVLIRKADGDAHLKVEEAH